MDKDLDSDVFGDTAEPVIVDCDVLEAAKENIQPLAKGRRVTALQAILSTPHALRESRLAATRNRLRINVEVALEDKDDDPLEAYCQFIHWVVENYPQGHSAESGLLELLEEATRILKDDRDGRWREDIRYLKLWVLYASYVEKPTVVFKFCLVNEIGTGHALLYEEFAIALERTGRKTAADDIYSIGIARRAEPLDRLESKYRDFQKRMMTHITPNAPPQPLHATQSSAARPASKPRKALVDTSRTRPAALPSQPSSSSNADVFTLPSTDGQRPNGRLQVFVDPPEGTAAESEAAPWQEFGTRKSRVKENLVEVSKAAGTILHQAGKARREIAARAPRMMVYRDSEGQSAEGDSTGVKGQTAHVESTNDAIDVPSCQQEERGEASLANDAPLKQSNDTDVEPHRQPTSEPVPERRITRSAARAAKNATASSESSVPVTEKKARAARSSAKVTASTPTEPPQITKKGKGKAKIPVYKDEEEMSGALQTPSSDTAPLPGERPQEPVVQDAITSPPPVSESSTWTSKAKIPVFRDEVDPQPITGSSRTGDKSAGGSKFAIHSDEPKLEQPSDLHRAAPSSKFAIRDDSPLPTPMALPKGKGRAPPLKLTVYRDSAEDGENNPSSASEMPPPPVSRPKPKTTRTASGSKIAVYRDASDSAPALARTASLNAAERSGAKAKLTVYRDDQGDGGSQVPSTPAPKFMPYRDEEVPPSPTMRGVPPPSVMKEKPLAAAGGRGLQMSSEAEALRKDPFKNYAAEDRVTDE